jgi:hypothetical protein
MNFANEQMLVDTFVCLLMENRSPWGIVCAGREFDYSRGRTDVVAICDTDTLIAIEAKLEDWKYALHQAYRNTCFAHRSFVLLPKAAALNAFSYAGEFEKRGVGLCYIDGAGIVILQEAAHTSPLEPWLAGEAISHVHKSGVPGSTSDAVVRVGVSCEGDLLFR